MPVFRDNGLVNMWTKILDKTTTESDEFNPGIPFALKLEGDTSIKIKLQSKREGDDNAEWSPGEIIRNADIVPCYAVQDTLYRVIAASPGINIFYNPVMVTYADRN